MNPAVLTFFLLASTGVTVSVVLYVAWSSFGRQAHARTWAIGSMLASLGWIAEFCGAVGKDQRLWYGQFAGLMMMGCRLLLLIGYRQRARLSGRCDGLILLLTFSSVCVLGSGAFGGELLRDVPVLGFGALCFLASLRIVARDRAGASPAERTAAVVLALSACFFIADLILAIALIPLRAKYSGGLFLLVLMFGIPVTFMSNGFACVLLLAADLAERMRALADTDPLTGALNRRGLDQLIAPTIANSLRRGEPIALVVADLDRFKVINDQHGHGTGDEVLRRFAAYVKREIRAGDLFARLGGEEFALVLPGASCAIAAEVTERLRAGVQTICAEAIAPLSLTASFGITALEAAADDLPSAFERADRALYTSKMTGRNRITVAAPRDAPAPVPVLAG